MIEHPPIAPLQRVCAALARAGIPHALGGSGLCAAFGLVDRVHDWDVTVETDLATLGAVFAGDPHETFGHSGCHADHKLNLEANGIELIARFAFFVEGGVVRIPTRVTMEWQGVPVGSPESWAAAYALMGALEEGPKRAQRAERSERLLALLARRGADAEILRVLLAEPLPAWLAAKLEALPLRV